MTRERVDPNGVDGAGPSGATDFRSTLDAFLQHESVAFAQVFSAKVACRPRDVSIHAVADRDVRDGSVTIDVGASAPTLKRSITGRVRVNDRVLESRAAGDPDGVAREIMRDVFDALQRQVDREIENLLTDDGKEERDRLAREALDPVASRRAAALDAVAQGRQARTSVRDVDAAIAAARAGMLSPQQALAETRRARNQGNRVPVVSSSRVPPGEVHAFVGGKPAGRITGISGVDPEPLAMRCAECGGRATLDGGEFGAAGASYRCGSCGVALDDCRHCRAIHVRRSDNTCPRCSGRERRKAKA